MNFAIFNIADSAVTLGATVFIVNLVVELFKSDKKNGKD